MNAYLDADDVVIAKLLGTLISKGGPKASAGLLPKPPARVQSKVDSYSRSIFANVANSGNPDLLAIRAVLELVWDNFLKPMKSKDEMQLQLDYGVNANSKLATRTALQDMIRDRDVLNGIQDQCAFLLDNWTEWMVRVRGAFGTGLTQGGVYAGASQIAFDEAALQMIRRQCKDNLQAVKEILPRLDRIIKKNQADLNVPFTSLYGPAF